MDEATLSAKKVIFSSLKLTTIYLVIAASLITFFGYQVLTQFPDERDFKSCFTTKMYKVYLCPTSGNYVKISQVSNYFVKTLILTEDSTFYQHHGFDLEEMQKSLKLNLEKGKFARGGSTLSQQLVKNLYLTKEKSLARKALEALITYRMEKVLTKKEILEKYVNVVQFGKGIFGIKAAAKYYFNKAPDDLTLVESSFLVFLLPNPENYAKSFYKKQLTPFAEKRLDQIIGYLYQYNRITEDEYAVAKNELSGFLQASPPQEIENIDELDEDIEWEL